MLIDFKVSNYKSLRDEQELSMLPSRSGKGFTALPVAAIYGANASGKSSLIEALLFKELLLISRPFYQSLSKPFLLDDISDDRSTVYEIEAEINGVRYEYRLAVSARGVEEEQLYSHPQNRRRTLLERTRDEITIGASMTNRSALQTLSSETPTGTPALAMAETYKATEWQPFWQWLKHELRTPAPPEGQDLPEALERHPVLIELVKVADLGLSDMRVATMTMVFQAKDRRQTSVAYGDAEDSLLRTFAVDEKPESEWAGDPLAVDMFSNLREVQFFHHGHRKRPLREADESRGTIAFLRHMADILDALHDGATLVIDEFDTSLHPRLIPRIIELFQDPRTNPRNAQLVFSTHDASLLGTSFGEPILKRDEVWFVEKHEDGASELYPLTSFKPRKEHNLERHYLGGSYGAVPDIYPASLVDIVAAANETE